MKPDIIHLHDVVGWYLNIDILFLYLKKINIPIIWTFHDCWAITGRCIYFDAIGCNRWQIGCGNCPQKNICREHGSLIYQHGISSGKSVYLPI